MIGFPKSLAAPGLLAPLVVSLVLVGSARAGGGVLVRQAPEVSPPYKYASSSSKVTVEMSSGSGTWTSWSKRSFDTKPTEELTAKISFPEPPERLTPGSEFSMDLKGTIGGYTIGRSSGPQAWIKSLKGVSVERSTFTLKPKGWTKGKDYLYRGSTSASQPVKLRVPERLRSGVEFEVVFGSTGRAKIIYRYVLEEDGEAVAPDQPEAEAGCGFEEDYASLRKQFLALAEIKKDPAIFQIDTRYKAHPFKLCIQEGKATLEASQEGWQRMAEASAGVLEAYVGASGGPGAARALVTGSLGGDAATASSKFVAASFRRQAAQRLRKAGPLSFRKIRALSKDADAIERFSKAAVSSALKEIEPATLARSKFSKKLEEVVNGGALEVPEDQGLEIYGQLMVAAEVVRANNEALYCRLMDSQARVFYQLRDLGRAARAASGDACARRVLEEHEQELSHMLGRLRQDITSAGKSHYDANQGPSWMFDAQYQSLGCVKHYGAEFAAISRKF